MSANSSDTSPPRSPILPVRLGLEDAFAFRCHKGIACFNKCCENIDILLTPYDIVRLKNRFKMSAREFIDEYTIDATLDAHGMPGLKLRTRAGSTACINLTPEGCGVYSERPAACRYYPLGLASVRRKDEPREEDSFFLVKEAHCLGHLEPQVQTIGDYRHAQDVELYDELNREWRRIVLKKRSSGPALGRPTQRSFELFFLASYDIDGFRRFVASAGFAGLFDVESAFMDALMRDEVELLKFGFRLLKQVLFGEMSIPLKSGPREARFARYRERLSEAGVDKAEVLARAQNTLYESLGDRAS